ncbi:MAG: response regulator [Bacteroidota bacterium]|nr:response regulator [Bacteroidota bacterium]
MVEISNIKKILLVDDDDTSNFINKLVLKGMNISPEIEVSTNGEDALEYLIKSCRENSNTECHTLILLDINMPVMNGFEFLDAIKNNPEIDDKDLHVCMLTSSTNPDDIKRAKTYNIQGYLDKPLTPEKIKKVLNENK